MAMTRAYHIHLTSDQKHDLLMMRDHDALPYIRVKAHGILQVSEGHTLQEVAHFFVLKRKKPETVKLWCERFLQEGREGLLVQAGRGRKPAFSPCAS
jgi:hypothetical protein